MLQLREANPKLYLLAHNYEEVKMTELGAY